MTGKPVVPRLLAERDVDAIIDYYLCQEAPAAALGFIDALQQAYTHIGQYPASGSTRYAYELELPGLRCWPLKRYPQLVFYVEQHEQVDVWRVLHGHADLPQWLCD